MRSAHAITFSLIAAATSTAAQPVFETEAIDVLNATADVRSSNALAFRERGSLPAFRYTLVANRGIVSVEAQYTGVDAGIEGEGSFSATNTCADYIITGPGSAVTAQVATEILFNALVVTRPALIAASIIVDQSSFEYEIPLVVGESYRSVRQDNLTPELTLPIGTPFTIVIDLQVDLVGDPGSQSTRVEAVFLLDDGPVFALPAGYTAESVCANVTDNVFGETCLTDTNGDGFLSPADFNTWLLAFNTGALVCDQNTSGTCDVIDFNAWVLNYNQGCP